MIYGMTYDNGKWACEAAFVEYTVLFADFCKPDNRWNFYIIWNLERKKPSQSTHVRYYKFESVCELYLQRLLI